MLFAAGVGPAPAGLGAGATPAHPATRGSSAAQLATPQQPTFGARTTRVRVDAVVTDSDGDFVADLVASDFELREDGVRQEILGVQLVDMAAGTVTALPMGVTEPGASGGGRGGADPERENDHPLAVTVAPDNLGALIFVVDLASLNVRAKQRFAEAWIELIEQTDALEVPRAAYSIDGYGNLEPLTALTFDLAALRDAADVVLESPSFGTQIHTRLRRLQLDMRNDFDPSNLVRAEEQSELVRSLNTFDALAALCTALGARPGRTALVWVSTGVKLMRGGPFTVLETESGVGGLVDSFEHLTPDRRIQAAQLELHEAANSSNVSIYALDPTLRSEEDRFGIDVESQTIGDANQLRSHEMQASLDGLRDSLRNASIETGGRSFIYGSDVGLSLATIREDSLRYYLLTYAPPRDDGDGAYHEIDVRVLREGVDVRARAGYIDWPADERRSRALAAALQIPESVGGTPLRATVVRQFGSEGRSIARVVAALDRTLPAGTAPAQPGELDVYAVVLRDAEVVDESRTTVRSAPDVTPTDDVERYLYFHDFELSPGSYEIRLAAQGSIDDSLSATRLTFEIDEGGHWATSDVLLLGRDDDARTRPLVEGVVETTETLTAYVEVANGSAPTISGAIFTPGDPDPLARVTALPLRRDDSQHFEGAVTLRGLSVGRYELQLDIADPPAGESASLSVPIEVTDNDPWRVAAEKLFGPDGDLTTPRAAVARRAGDPADRLLASFARLAEIHRGDVLRFTARETVVETDHADTVPGSPPSSIAPRLRVVEFRYAHDPSDPRADASGGYRSPIAAPPPELATDSAPGGLFEGFALAGLLDRAFSWPSLFSPGPRDDEHRFEVAGNDSALGRPAILLAFRPADRALDDADNARIDANDARGTESGWFGTAWFDAETLQPLRVHALRRTDYNEKLRFAAALASGEPAPDFVFTEITTDYTEEANGLRFPGQVTVSRNRYRVTGDAPEGFRALPVVTAAITYVDYVFERIPSDEEVRRIVSGVRR